MRAALIANESDADAGFIGHALRRRGFHFMEYLREQHQSWPSLDGIDLVVAMGSSWSTYWEEMAGPITAEQSLMREAIARNIPLLGVCFGAQQLATVLGGTVTNAQSPEIGWHSVSPVRETAAVCPPVLVEGPWMQWHYDRFSVPPGATVLAESAVGPQAIISGTTCGVQFHPEATESIVRLWSSGEGAEELTAQGIDRDSLMQVTAHNVSDAEHRCDQFIAWFLRSVALLHIPLG